MPNEDQTSSQLAAELVRLGQRIQELERSAEDRIPAETRLRESHDLYRQLVENSQGLICKHDLRGTLLYTSPASAHELGYEPQIAAGRNLRDLLSPEVAHRFDDYLKRIMQTGVDRGVLRLRRKDGQERLWAYRNQLYIEPDREPYVVGHAIDITDRIRAEALLRESEERSRAVIHTLEEGVIFGTADGLISGCNPSAERILGRSAAEMIGLLVSDPLWHAVNDDGSPLPVAAHPMIHTLKTGQPCSRVTMGVERPDGSVVWLEINSQPMIEAEKRSTYGVVASFTDITDRRRRERERDRELQEALARLRVLSGILPICASCKRIRDDRGNWHEVEVYVRDHSEAQFTHGFCPECSKRLFPDE